MNVNKINTLSGIHRTLSRFHKLCANGDVELVAQVVTHPQSEIVLGSPITQSIISRVQATVAEEIADLEDEIKKEIADG